MTRAEAGPHLNVALVVANYDAAGPASNSNAVPTLDVNRITSHLLIGDNIRLGHRVARMGMRTAIQVECECV